MCHKIAALPCDERFNLLQCMDKQGFGVLYFFHFRYRVEKNADMYSLNRSVSCDKAFQKNCSGWMYTEAKQTPECITSLSTSRFLLQASLGRDIFPTFYKRLKKVLEMTSGILRSFLAGSLLQRSLGTNQQWSW